MATTCSTCKYVDAKARKPGPDGDDTALCRFSAPVVTTPFSPSPWPFCKMTDWCGRWAPKDP